VTVDYPRGLDPMEIDGVTYTAPKIVVARRPNGTRRIEFNGEVLPFLTSGKIITAAVHPKTSLLEVTITFVANRFEASATEADPDWDVPHVEEGYR
jgi:hypothetical protein